MAFDRAKEGLRRWQAHVGAGATVFPGDRISQGETVLVLLRFGPLQIVAPCRIVYGKLVRFDPQEIAGWLDRSRVTG